MYVVQGDTRDRIVRDVCAAHDAILKAIERVLVEGPRTRDLGGSASTTEMGEAIAALI